MSLSHTKNFLFQLRRISGQPELVLKKVMKSKKSRVRNLLPQPSKKSRVRNRIIVHDISQGKEEMPISAVNTVDSEKMPTQFEYITTMCYSSWCNLQPFEGCGCIDGCTDLKKCSCSIKNSNKEIPYNENGAICRAKSFIYECSPSCKCPPMCQNRVSQNGIKFKLELFKTESRGWGVRSLDYIRSGSFICEYTGELLKDSDAEKRYDDEYLFDISHGDDDEDGFTIDAAQYGNIGRFINHSCSPNLFTQKVLYDHNDKRMPHIMLFAQENIRPMTELTYHYNYKQVCDSNGNMKKKDCYCGSSKCKGRLY